MGPLPSFWPEPSTAARGGVTCPPVPSAPATQPQRRVSVDKDAQRVPQPAACTASASMADEHTVWLFRYLPEGFWKPWCSW